MPSADNEYLMRMWEMMSGEDGGSGIKTQGGGGGGGAATIADGADVAQGSKADAPASSTVVQTAAPMTLVSLVKGIINAIIGLAARIPATLGAHGGMPVEGVAGGVAQPVSISGQSQNAGATDAATLRVVTANDGPLNTAIGTTTDAPASSTVAEDTTARSQVSLLKGIKNVLLSFLSATFKVGGQTIVKSVSFSRGSGTSAYVAKQSINQGVAITGGTNASPIVVSATAHGLADGDFVTIAGVTGNTNMNGSFYAKVTGYSANTFALYSDKALTTPVAGNGTYGGSPTWSRCLRLKGILRTAGGSGYLTKLRLLTNSATFLDQIRIHIYNSPLATVVDQSAYTLLWSHRTLRLGYVDMPALATEGSGSDSSYSLATSNTPSSGAPTNLPLEVHNAETPPDTDLWVRFEDMGTGTPVAGQTFFLEAIVDCN